MAFRYGYFDSDIIGIDDEGMPIFDRAETSDLFALLFASLVSDGVLALPATCFQVKAAGSGMDLEVSPGFGMVKGHFCYDDETAQLTAGPSPQTYERIDRVIMRCNYLQRMVEIIIKTGEESANPVPPALIRPAAGDYFELCLANIRLTAGQKTITQSSITDTRADSSVCGYITQLIGHLDTAVFFDQLNAFYDEFVDKSNTSYAQFTQMAADAFKAFTDDISQYIATLKQDSTDAYDDLISSMETFRAELVERCEALYSRFDTDITSYIATLKNKGDTDLAAITQQLLDFRNTNEAEFLAWFERIKGIFGTDPGGNMLNEIEKLSNLVNDLSDMLYAGAVTARLETEEGDYITDDTGIPILVEWPICRCSG